MLRTNLQKGPLMSILLTLLLVTVLLLSSCTSQKKIDSAVKEATSLQLAQIDMLNDNVTALQRKISTQEAEKQALVAEKEAAITEFSAINRTLMQKNAVLNDYVNDIASCEESLNTSEEKNSALEKKVTVLQGWVDLCQENLDNLGK